MECEEEGASCDSVAIGSTIDTLGAMMLGAWLDMEATLTVVGILSRESYKLGASGEYLASDSTCDDTTAAGFVRVALDRCVVVTRVVAMDSQWLERVSLTRDLYECDGATKQGGWRSE